MKKHIKSLLVVLALATAFVCAMAVATFAAEYNEGLTATPITCDQWNGHDRVEVTFTLTGDEFQYDQYMFARNVNYPHIFNGTTLNYETEPGATYNLYGRNYHSGYGWGSWHQIEGVSTIVQLQHVLDEDSEHYTAPTCERPGVDTYYDCYCEQVHYDKDGEVIEHIAAWSGEGGAGYIAPLGHMAFWGVEEYAAPGHHTHTCHVLRCETCRAVLEYHRVNTSYSERVLVEQQDPTCTEAGHKAYYYCVAFSNAGEECDLYFTDPSGEGEENIIGDSVMLQRWLAEGGEGYLAPTGHKWDKGVVQKDGSTLYTCEVCKATKVASAEKKETGVATGDAENMGLWMMLAIAAMVAAGYAVSRKEN